MAAAFDRGLASRASSHSPGQCPAGKGAGTGSRSVGSFTYCGRKSLSPASGALNSYGPRYTFGVRSQFPCGAGLGSDHSIPLSSQGFCGAFFPNFRLQKKLKANRICVAKSANAEYEMKT